jgi:hypothetical protein
LRASVFAGSVNEKGGFGQVPKPKSKAKPLEEGVAAPSAQAQNAPSSAQPAPKDIEEVLARAGLKPSSRPSTDITVPSTAPPPPPAVPGPLASVPMEIQNQMETTFVAAAGLALTFFIICGFAVVGDAYVTVSKATVPPYVSAALTKLAPLLTPSLGVVLLCSITLGLFKQAQFSDASNDLVYREEDE